MDPRHKSRLLVDGPDRAAARSYFKAVGFTDQDLARPLVGVAHCWIEITPCNWNHQKLAERVRAQCGGDEEAAPRLEGAEAPLRVGRARQVLPPRRIGFRRRSHRLTRRPSGRDQSCPCRRSFTTWGAISRARWSSSASVRFAIGWGIRRKR
jgi:hypothetical protein